MFENFDVPSNLIPSDPRFGVGPSLIPMTYLDSLKETGTKLLGTSHRQAEVIKLVNQVQEGFKQYFDLPEDYVVMLGNGGASYFFDMIGLGLVKQKSSHFVCGEFSHKWYLAHKKIPWINTELVEVEYGQGVDPKLLEEVDTLCCTLNETSTGVILKDVPDAKETDCLICVDATSGAGQVPLDITKVDVYFLSPQKVFAAEGGLYIALMSPKAIERFRDIQKLNRYIPQIMEFEYAYQNALKGQTSNTPCVTNIFYLNEQLKLMNKLGRNVVERQAVQKAELIYTWADQHAKLDPFVKDQKYRSMAVATINLDENYSANDLAKRLRELDVAYDIEGYRKLGLNQLRISLFHNVSIADLRKLTQIINLALDS